MTSQYWDAGQAHEYHEFRYRFTEKSLGAKTIVVGGAGGRSPDRRLSRPSRACGSSSRRHRIFVWLHRFPRRWRYASAAVRQAFLTAAQRFSAPFAGMAIFPGDPARVAFEDLNRETLLASVESNYLGPVLGDQEMSRVPCVFFLSRTTTSPVR
jgi:hypothetical protein